MSSTERTPVSAFDERLPHIIFEPVSVRKLLYEMLDCVLAETEEVRSRYRIRVHAVTDMVRCANNDRPGAGGCTSYDGFLGLVVGDDLEARTRVAVQDLAMVHHLGVGIASREIPSGYYRR